MDGSLNGFDEIEAAMKRLLGKMVEECRQGDSSVVKRLLAAEAERKERRRERARNARRLGHATIATVPDPPDPPPQLQLEAYTLIAWRIGAEGHTFGEPDWLYGLWRPANGKGWYESGYYCPPCPSYTAGIKESPGSLEHWRASRSRVLTVWRMEFRGQYQWHHLMTEAEAFPEKRRKYVRPRRIAWPKRIDIKPTATVDDLPELFEE